jgi:gliding motility-associated-like protein
MAITDEATDEELGDILYLAENTPVTLYVDAGPGASYSWLPNQWISDPLNAQVQITPMADIVYIATGITSDGCTEKDTLQVIIRQPVKVYTGFSPNGDGINDTWIIENGEQYGSLIYVRVFNRWGEIIFETKGYGGSQQWDGTRNGKMMPVGSYYYIIEISEYLSKPLTGTVTILR